MSELRRAPRRWTKGQERFLDKVLSSSMKHSINLENLTGAKDNKRDRRGILDGVKVNLDWGKK